MKELVRKVSSIVVMPEFEDSRSASMWRYRLNPIMLIVSALTK